jgi:hypothetical protein
LFNCLGLREFSWLSLNKLLYLTGLARASNSALQCSLIAVLVKTVLTLAFRFLISLPVSVLEKPGFSRANMIQIFIGVCILLRYVQPVTN